MFFVVVVVYVAFIVVVVIYVAFIVVVVVYVALFRLQKTPLLSLFLNQHQGENRIIYNFVFFIQYTIREGVQSSPKL